ncbi:proteasome assembly chaperone 4-like [Biomphalaria glabrata]|uniref:Proteasome assembly chaperone 4-like n=1 Tax=Biomphalaria glabrata TaxID=6526 RepID=A0A9W3B0P5_BIOGL|nr:proteasome assembly chaperone 4-like [Biomphalaria glabrata]
MDMTPSICITDFSENILDKSIHFKIIRLEQSFFVWVGSKPMLSNMAVAMPATYGQIPAVSTLFGAKLEQISESLAQKLAKKYKCQVFVSCSVPFDANLSVLIEKRLAQELNQIFPSS